MITSASCIQPFCCGATGWESATNILPEIVWNSKGNWKHGGVCLRLQCSSTFCFGAEIVEMMSHFTWNADSGIWGQSFLFCPRCILVSVSRQFAAIYKTIAGVILFCVKVPISQLLIYRQKHSNPLLPLRIVSVWRKASSRWKHLIQQTASLCDLRPVAAYSFCS